MINLNIRCGQILNKHIVKRVNPLEMSNLHPAHQRFNVRAFNVIVAKSFKTLEIEEYRHAQQKQQHKHRAKSKIQLGSKTSVFINSPMLALNSRFQQTCSRPDSPQIYGNESHNTKTHVNLTGNRINHSLKEKSIFTGKAPQHRRAALQSDNSAVMPFCFRMGCINNIAALDTIIGLPGEGEPDHL